MLLLEADLRRPTLAQQLDIQSGPGLSDVLIGAVSLSEATQTIALDASPLDGSRGGCSTCWWPAPRCRPTRAS